MRRLPILLSSLALASTAVVVPAALPTLAQEACQPGTLYFSQDDNPNGLYTVDVVTGAATLVGEGITGVDSSTVGLTESNDPSVLWGSTWTDFSIINADGSGANVLDTDFRAEALGYDPGRDVLYGGINGEFFTVDPTTGQRVDETLAQPGADIEGLAVDPATSLVYGIAGQAGSPLYVYDPGGDAWDTIALSQNIDWDSVGLAYDPNTQTLYAINEDESVYSITLEGGVELIGSLGLGAEFQGGGAAFVPGDCPTPPTTPTTAEPTTTTTAAPPTTAAAAPATVTPRFTG